MSGYEQNDTPSQMLMHNVFISSTDLRKAQCVSGYCFWTQRVTYN